MKKSIWILALLISSCGGSNPNNLSDTQQNQIPEGATVRNYEAIPGLQKAVIESGEKILGEGDFLNGLYHGTWVSYDPVDGKVKSMTTYFEGKKQGVELLFDNSGYVESKAYYHNDVLNGEYLVFKRRKVVERKHYNNGSLDGPARKFYVNGTVMEESNYVMGKIDGVARWYDQEGNLTIEYEYDLGQLIEE